MSKLYSKMKTSKETLGVCSITGIIITIDIPYIPISKVFTYENPLSRIDNAKELALLPYSTQSKISPHILAGCLLTILNHYELIEDHLSSIERNEFLSSIPPYYLCEAMRFICSQSARRISLFPRISLSSVNDSIYSTPINLLRNYISVCNSCLIATFSNSILNNKEESRKERRKEREYSLSFDTKQRCKVLINNIIEQENLNVKIITLFKAIITGNNLVTLHDSMRDKLVSKLRELNSNDTNEFADILEEIKSNITSPERAFKQESEEILNTAMSDLPPLKVKRSLKDILQAKKEGKDIKEIPSIEDKKESLREEILALEASLQLEDYEDYEDSEEEENESFNPNEF